MIRILLCACVLSSAAWAQTSTEKTDWLRSNAHDLRSVESSKDDDYPDLYWLGQALQGVRVVGLGEATHGDGTTFAMKVRLVRYLQGSFGRAGQTKGEDARWARLEQAVAQLRVPANPQQPFDSSGYDAGFIADLQARLGRSSAAFHQVWSEREIEFTRQLLKSFSYLERYLREAYGKKDGAQAGAIFKRDVGMGLNLLWLVEKVYPDRKVIVWAHSGHLQKDFEPAATDANFRTEGLHGSSFAPVKLALGKQAYSLAFLSSEGSTGSANHPEMPREAIPASNPQSLQALCRDTGRPLFFLDFASLPADHWLRQPVEANFLFHAQIFNTPAEMVRNWTDGSTA